MSLSRVGGVVSGSQSSPTDLRSGLPVGSYPVLAGQRENHREGFRFQPRARDNCRSKSLQFFSFLAFYPEPVTTALRQRTVTPTWQRYAVVAGAAGPRREPGPDNPHPPCQTGVQGIRLPPGTRPGQEGTRPWYFRGAPLGLDVFPGMSGAGPGPSRSRITGCSARSAGYLWTSTTTSGSITGRAA